MKKRSISIFSLLIFVGSMLQAQNLYNIRLSALNLELGNKVCYDIQLESATGQTWHLAGQNYRLFYDATLLKFDPSWSWSYLPTDSYTDLMLVQDVHNVEALVGGKLAYEDHLGFINFSVDLKNVTKGGIQLPGEGTPQNTVRICFELQQTNKSLSNGINWARADMTAAYATAFVEVSEWVGPNQTSPANPNEFYDLEQINTTKEEVVKAWKIYPNPTADKLQVELNEFDAINLYIRDMWGREVIRRQIEKGTLLHQIDISQLPAGPYTIQLQDEDKLFHKIFEKI